MCDTKRHLVTFGVAHALFVLTHGNQNNTLRSMFLAKTLQVKISVCLLAVFGILVSANTQANKSDEILISKYRPYPVCQLALSVLDKNKINLGAELLRIAKIYETVEYASLGMTAEEKKDAIRDLAHRTGQMIARILKNANEASRLKKTETIKIAKQILVNTEVALILTNERLPSEKFSQKHWHTHFFVSTLPAISLAFYLDSIISNPTLWQSLMGPALVFTTFKPCGYIFDKILSYTRPGPLLKIHEHIIFSDIFKKEEANFFIDCSPKNIRISRESLKSKELTFGDVSEEVDEALAIIDIYKNGEKK